jgi:hypothetical protein
MYIHADDLVTHLNDILDVFGPDALPSYRAMVPHNMQQHVPTPLNTGEPGMCANS